MKNIHKKMVAIIMVLTLAIGCNIMAYAAEVPAFHEVVPKEYAEATISPRGNTYESSGIAVTSKGWKTVAKSTTGFGCNVQINTLNTRVNYVSVLMIGKDGRTEIWSETNAIPYNKSRVFYCGTDVYEIRVKCVGDQNTSTVSAWPTDREPGIYSDPYI